MTNEQTITVTLTLNEANIMMAGLGKLPFEMVVDLIGKIRHQAEQQLQPPSAPTPSEG